MAGLIGLGNRLGWCKIHIQCMMSSDQVVQACSAPHNISQLQHCNKMGTK